MGLHKRSGPDACGWPIDSLAILVGLAGNGWRLLASACTTICDVSDGPDAAVFETLALVLGSLVAEPSGHDPLSPASIVSIGCHGLAKFMARADAAGQDYVIAVEGRSSATQPTRRPTMPAATPWNREKRHSQFDVICKPSPGFLGRLGVERVRICQLDDLRRGLADGKTLRARATNTSHTGLAVAARFVIFVVAVGGTGSFRWSRSGRTTTSRWSNRHRRWRVLRRRDLYREYVASGGRVEVVGCRGQGVVGVQGGTFDWMSQEPDIRRPPHADNHAD